MASRPDYPENDLPPELPPLPEPEPELDPSQPVPEVGGRGGPDPTRYGDWEIGGRAVDF